ncbi:hypothetical protein K5X82_15325 [Halosquirtibacter xylanolyticus]|uniref:WD40/YVTN/BNR-like repeat-containing protein n=1 Tax=Halosquirtibacter xylanolyticus TaxID=3374599 RepID=UPI003747EC0A|nr:hypothetical protein K5X82_15325 [Prolixibacteraceae bacterium]
MKYFILTVILFYSCSKDADLLPSKNAISDLTFEDVVTPKNISHIDFVNKEIGYAMDHQCVYKTMDWGKNWQKIYSSQSLVDIQLFDDHHLMVVERGGKDNAQLLVTTSNDDFATKNNVMVCDYNISTEMSTFNDGTAFIINQSGMYKSADYGRSWHRMDNVPFRVSEIARNGNGDLFCESNNSGEVLKSSDQGETWTAVSTSFESNIQLQSTPSVDQVYFSVDGVLYSTMNFIQWKQEILEPKVQWNDYLFVTEEGKKVCFNHNVTLVAMESPIGLWLVDSNGKIKYETPYDLVLDADEVTANEFVLLQNSKMVHVTVK